MCMLPLNYIFKCLLEYVYFGVRDRKKRVTFTNRYTYDMKLLHLNLDAGLIGTVKLFETPYEI